MEGRLHEPCAVQLCWWRLFHHMQTDPCRHVKRTEHVYHAWYNDTNTITKIPIQKPKHAWTLPKRAVVFPLNSLLKPCFPDTNHIQFNEKQNKSSYRLPPALPCSPGDNLLPSAIPLAVPDPLSRGRGHIFLLFPRICWQLKAAVE